MIRKPKAMRDKKTPRKGFPGVISGIAQMSELAEVALFCKDGKALARHQWEHNRIELVVGVYSTLIALDIPCSECAVTELKSFHRTTLDYLEMGLHLIGQHETACLVQNQIELVLKKLKCTEAFGEHFHQALDMVENQPEQSAYELISLN